MYSLKITKIVPKVHGELLMKSWGEKVKKLYQPNYLTGHPHIQMIKQRQMHLIHFSQTLLSPYQIPPIIF